MRRTGCVPRRSQFGPRSQYNQRGLAARTLSAVFRQLSRQGISDATVRMSALEIYNETMIDMLQVSGVYSVLCKLNSVWCVKYIAFYNETMIDMLQVSGASHA